MERVTLSRSPNRGRSILRTGVAPVNIAVRLVPAAKPASGDIVVNTSRFDATHLLFFDRFRVERSARFIEMQFGYYGHERELQDGLIVIVATEVVDAARDSLLNYVQQMQIAMPEASELSPCNIHGDTRVTTADSIGLARHGEAVGEIIFHTFSWKVAVETVRTPQPTNREFFANCVALLRCDVELQKRWLLALYENVDEQ